MYPFLLTRSQRKHESVGLKLYVFVTIGVAVLLVVGWFYWMNATMFNSSRPSRRPAASYQKPEVNNDVNDDFNLGDQPGADPSVVFDWAGESILSTPDWAGGATPVPVLPAVVGPVVGVEVGVQPESGGDDLAEWVPALPPVAELQLITVAVRSYWPDDGPDWCETWDYRAARCISPMTSGDDWRQLEGAALACPAEWLGGEIYFATARRWLPCLDTGETFACDGELCVVGVLSQVSVGLHHQQAWVSSPGAVG